jgi:calcineurin-like phosphoesterase family protein
MNREIVRRWNDVVDKDDLVYHVGDFAFKGILNGRRFEKILNGDIVHIQGNHDLNNGIKTYITKCMMFFGGKDVFVQHHPPEIIPICDFVLCGHIHEKWKFKLLKKHPNIPIINIGVDVNQFVPVSTNSVLKQYSEIKGKYCRKNLTGDFKSI